MRAKILNNILLSKIFGGIITEFFSLAIWRCHHHIEPEFAQRFFVAFVLVEQVVLDAVFHVVERGGGFHRLPVTAPVNVFRLLVHAFCRCKPDLLLYLHHDQPH